MIEVLLIIKNYIAYSFMLIGCLFIIAGVIGINRMPDFFTRLHPAGVIDSVGCGMICLGFIIFAIPEFASLKIVILIIFLLITAPTACHALANSYLPKQKKKK